MKKQTAPFKKDAIANNYGESGSHPLLPQNKALILRKQAPKCRHINVFVLDYPTQPVLNGLL